MHGPIHAHQLSAHCAHSPHGEGSPGNGGVEQHARIAGALEHGVADLAEVEGAFQVGGHDGVVLLCMHAPTWRGGWVSCDEDVGSADVWKADVAEVESAAQLGPVHLCTPSVRKSTCSVSGDQGGSC